MGDAPRDPADSTDVARGGPDSSARRGHGGYRADIEGLRGVAVLLVVLFHAGVSGMRGGFAGYDVFYVLSGYLNTDLLVREVERSGTISFVQFYARRTRRLLPAAVLVLRFFEAARSTSAPSAGTSPSMPGLLPPNSGRPGAFHMFRSSTSLI